MPARYRGRTTLGQGLDKEVYQVARKIIDDWSDAEDKPPRWTPASIYATIQKSNSSLSRKPRKLLEDSLERVLATIQQDAEDSDAVQQSTTNMDITSSSNLNSSSLSTTNMNRNLVRAWSLAGTPTSLPAAAQQHDQDATTTSNAATTGHKRQSNGQSTALKRRKTAPSIDRQPPTHVNFADLGGVASVVAQFQDLVVLPMNRPEWFVQAQIKPIRGILIHGPPGCGKTMIANALAAELEVSFISISAPSIVSGMSGESEKALRDHFEEAKRHAPCLMFIDEIDAITPKREGAQREMEKRIVAQLLTCMDDLDLEKTNGKPVIVMAATNRPDSLDPALRRSGRFDKEINMQVPNEGAREQILRALTRKTSVSADIDFTLLARRTPGFVGADLNDLVSTAGTAAMRRVLHTLELQAQSSQMDLDDMNGTAVPSEGSAPIDAQILSFRRLSRYLKQSSTLDQIQQLEGNPETEGSSENTQISNTTAPIMQLTMQDFLSSLKKVQPSALREGFSTIPSTTFASIGALGPHIQELQSTIIRPIRFPKLYTDLGITPSSGALLWGPPGCGKTLLAKAVANSSHANFISVKGPELLNKYVGESERAVRQVFTRARSSVPVVIFLDEVDALVPRRDGNLNEASSRVVNMMLTELDGVGQSREGIYVIAATNRPDMVDPAMLRPGRLENLLFVGLPDANGRADILRTLCKRLKNFEWSDDIGQVARSCDGFSGADLESLLRRAGNAAIERAVPPLPSSTTTMTMNIATVAADRVEVNAAPSVDARICLADFKVARAEVTRSVDADEVLRFERLRKSWGQSV